MSEKIATTEETIYFALDTITNYDIEGTLSSAGNGSVDVKLGYKLNSKVIGATVASKDYESVSLATVTAPETYEATKFTTDKKVYVEVDLVMVTGTQNTVTDVEGNVVTLGGEITSTQTITMGEY